MMAMIASIVLDSYATSGFGARASSLSESQPGRGFCLSFSTVEAICFSGVEYRKEGQGKIAKDKRRAKE